MLEKIVVLIGFHAWKWEKKKKLKKKEDKQPTAVWKETAQVEGLQDPFY